LIEIRQGVQAGGVEAVELGSFVGGGLFLPVARRKAFSDESHLNLYSKCAGKIKFDNNTVNNSSHVKFVMQGYCIGVLE
jgi:hypothetical protein